MKYPEAVPPPEADDEESHRILPENAVITEVRANNLCWANEGEEHRCSYIKLWQLRGGDPVMFCSKIFPKLAAEVTIEREVEGIAPTDRNYCHGPLKNFKPNGH